MAKFQIRHFLAAALLSGSLCFSAEIFVSPSGNDTTGNGSIGTPYLTIGKGISVMSTGDTLNIRGGTYEEYIENTVPTGTDWDTPTTVQAYNGETVILNAATPSSVDLIRVTGFAKHHIIFNGLTLDGVNMVNGGNGAKITYNTEGLPATHIMFTNCIVKNIYNGMGFLLTSGVDYTNTWCQFLSCTVTRAGYSGNDSPNKHGIYISTSGNLIDSCTIYSNLNLGLHFFGGQPSSNIVRNCTFPTTPGKDAIGLYGGTNNQFYNNVIYQHNVGIIINPNGFVADSLLANNSFSSNGVGIILQVGTAGSPGTATIVNNLISDQSNDTYGGINLGTGASTAAAISVENNIIAGSGLKGQINDIDGAATVLNNLTNQSSVGFLNSSAQLFNLATDSIAIDQGQTLTNFVTDKVGVTRPKKTAWDVGAYEFDPLSILISGALLRNVKL
jgi:hypothetical protein